MSMSLEEQTRNMQERTFCKWCVAFTPRGVLVAKSKILELGI